MKPTYDPEGNKFPVPKKTVILNMERLVRPSSTAPVSEDIGNLVCDRNGTKHMVDLPDYSSTNIRINGNSIGMKMMTLISALIITALIRVPGPQLDSNSASTVTYASIRATAPRLDSN